MFGSRSPGAAHCHTHTWADRRPAHWTPGPGGSTQTSSASSWSWRRLRDSDHQCRDTCTLTVHFHDLFRFEVLCSIWKFTDGDCSDFSVSVFSCARCEMSQSTDSQERRERHGSGGGERESGPVRRKYRDTDWAHQTSTSAHYSCSLNSNKFVFNLMSRI